MQHPNHFNLDEVILFAVFGIKIRQFRQIRQQTRVYCRILEIDFLP